MVVVATSRVEGGEEEDLRLEVAVHHTVAVAEPECEDLCFKGREKHVGANLTP